WKEQPLGPNEKREVGFEYGLWELASASGRLAATVDGVFRPDGELTVVAYVARSGQEGDETVTLTLPEGFRLVEGEATQRVRRRRRDAKSATQPVTWKVRAGAAGDHELTLRTSTGLTQTLSVKIKGEIFK